MLSYCSVHTQFINKQLVCDIRNQDSIFGELRRCVPVKTNKAVYTSLFVYLSVSRIYFNYIYIKKNKVSVRFVTYSGMINSR